MQGKFKAGDIVGIREFASAGGDPVAVPDPARLVHLQFRRFACCAFCNIHLRSFEARHKEIAEAAVREVVVFRSNAGQLNRNVGDVPYTVILDPTGKLYKQFGVVSGVRSLLDPRAAVMALPNLVRSFFPGRVGLPAGDSLREGLLGFPADFLIGTDGRIVACEYGSHAGDGWTVDRLLELARRHAVRA